MTRHLSIGNQHFDLSRSIVMGILNVTPDSFSDGGWFDRVDHALEHALRMQQEGADIIDIGGESTRPGAQAVTLDEELERVIPVIRALRQQTAIPISIDTSKPEVMQAAVEAGADMVNDVNALQANGAIRACAELEVPVCLMHMQGEPRTMQQDPTYDDVVSDVAGFLRQRSQACIDAGIERDRIILDPGFGFGKTLQHNLALLNGLEVISGLELPVLVGLSRKSMLGVLIDKPVDQRVYASVAAAVIARNKGAQLFRVHDVSPTRDALALCDALNNEQQNM
ncbi:MAG: dihydropteroate synthase [Gammaproteobacteria bacterium]|nr:dihydropteroate synthase [Gammaproteobacteria bacterium]